MVTFKLEVTIKVHETWIVDGYAATPERIEKIIRENDLTYAYDHEYRVKAKMLSGPTKKELKEIGNKYP